MKKTIIFCFLTACSFEQERVKPDPLVELASTCVTQLSSCDDWTPRSTAKYVVEPKQEECERFDYKCECRNQERHELYQRELMRPALVSICERKIELCTDIVRAVAAQQVHHHYMERSK